VGMNREKIIPGLFNQIIKFSIYLLVFLLPLFWLPFSFEAFEFNKQYLLFFFVSIAFFAWLAKQVLLDKEIRFKRTSLDIFVLAFLFVAILSAIFSVDRSSSIFGFYGRFSDSLVGLISLAVLYFLITNHVGPEVKNQKPKAEESPKENHSAPIISIEKLLRVFLVAVFFVSLVSYFSIFGLWTKLDLVAGGIFPPLMLQGIFNPVSGSMEGLTIFLSIALVLTIGLFLWTREKLALLGYFLLVVLGLGLLIIINYNPAWIILLVSLSLFLVLVLIKRIFRENVNKLLLPIFLIIISTIFLFIEAGIFPLPREEVLDQRISWKVALGAATENLKSGFLGSGIGTFHYGFARHKPLEINQTWLWQIRFDRPGSHLAEIFATTGFLGILSYLLIVGIFLLIFWFLVGPKSQFPVSSFQFPILMTFVALLVGQLVYYQNTTLAFTFWLVLGLGAVSWPKSLKEKTISFRNFPELSLMFLTLIIILGIVIFSLYYFGFKFYLADANYKKSLEVEGEAQIEKLEKAVNLNPHFLPYRVALSRAYLFELFRELQKPLEEQDKLKIQTLIASMIDEAKRTTDLWPNSVVSWENLGIIYREIIGIVAGAADWSIKSFERAIELEPTNPVLYTELGKLYMFLEDKEKAKEYFERALEKKSDYADAIIQKALLLERKDILEEAIAKLEDLIIRDPWNIEVYFQLGRLYFNAGRLDEAIFQLERVVELMPNHTNALYSLAIVYREKGEIEKAIEALEKVLELDPGNQEVIQKLEELKEL